MPGIVVFKRRWSVGSDDLVVPALFLVVLHLVWVVVLAVILRVVNFDLSPECTDTLQEHVLGYLVILSCCALLEGVIVGVSMRGSILNTEPRNSMQYLLYARLVVLVGELVWLCLGVVWAAQHYKSCSASPAKRAVLGIIVCNWVIMLSVLISVWCTFDTAGRSWVKMKRYQESVKERQQRAGQKRRSGSRRRNWRHRYTYQSVPNEADSDRKAMRAYEQSWDRRCQFLFCCVKEDRHRNSFAEVAKLFTEFFRDLDVVPTDIVAGLVLLRTHQKLRRKVIVSQGSNDVYQFLSGVPVMPSTKFLSMKQPETLSEYKRVIHYMRYALAAYGWPMYMMMNAGTGLCKIMPHLRCCACCCPPKNASLTVQDDCCQCNYGAMKKLSGLKEVDMVHVTYHVDIGETPFYVAVDHGQKTVVISIRGTLSLQDVLTDLKAEAEPLPVDPPREDWMAHKGMVQAAVYIKKKIKEEMLLSKAFSKDLDKGTLNYELVVVGHSLGAGTAAILSIMLRQEFPTIQCYAYSPPGGLLSATCVEDTKSFITSVVVGKDVVPRIGLHQLEILRQDLITVIKKSEMPKWRTIGGSMLCCCKDDGESLSEHLMETNALMKHEKDSNYFPHPSDSQIALTSHTALFPPGKIIHVVRNHPKNSSKLCGSPKPVYQAIWAENTDFDEVLISPTMVNDHMPDNVLDALEKVLTNTSPAKPTRKLPECERRALLTANENNELTPPPHRVCLETSFTNLSPPELEDLNRSSGAYSLGSDDNSLSWDYAAANAAGNAAQFQRQSSADPSSSPRVHSFPPSTHMSKARPPNLKLDFSHDDWLGMAPLATPETMSDTSSLESAEARINKRLSNGYHKLKTGVGTMEPIQQSPLRQAHSEGYCYFVEPPSPVDYVDTPERDFNALSSVGPIEPLAQSTPMKDIQVAVNNGRHKAGISDESMDSSLPLTSSTQDDGCTPLLHNDTTDSTASVSSDNSHPLQVSEQESAILPPNLTDDSTFNLTATEQKIQNKLEQIEASEPYRLAYENETLSSLSRSSSGEFRRHSPDSSCNQLVYDDCLGHYSPAGRGYPHGGYMQPYMSADPQTVMASEITSDDNPSGQDDQHGMDGVVLVDVVTECSANGGLPRQTDSLVNYTHEAKEQPMRDNNSHPTEQNDMPHAVITHQTSLQSDCYSQTVNGLSSPSSSVNTVIR